MPTPKQQMSQLEEEQEQEVYYEEMAGPALPDRPPFKVYVSNVPYELDELMVERYFEPLQVREPGMGSLPAPLQCQL